MQSYLVNIRKENHDFNEREMKILKALLLNRIGQASLRTVDKSMALNPLEINEDELFNYQIVLQEEVNEEQGKELFEVTEKFIKNALKLSDIDECVISVKREY